MSAVAHLLCRRRKAILNIDNWEGIGYGVLDIAQIPEGLRFTRGGTSEATQTGFRLKGVSGVNLHVFARVVMSGWAASAAGVDQMRAGPGCNLAGTIGSLDWNAYFYAQRRFTSTTSDTFRFRPRVYRAGAVNSIGTEANVGDYTSWIGVPIDMEIWQFGTELHYRYKRVSDTVTTEPAFATDTTPLGAGGVGIFAQTWPPGFQVDLLDFYWKAL